MSFGGSSGMIVALTAAGESRRLSLAAMLTGAGHEVIGPDQPAGALADAEVIDLAPGAGLADGGALPRLVLTDRPGLSGESEIEGVLARDASAEQIDAALRAIRAGLRVREAAAAEGFAPADITAASRLTPREIEVLAAIRDGLSNKEAARRLGISAHTVKFHLEAIFHKLDVTTRAQAVANGLRQGVIEV